MYNPVRTLSLFLNQSTSIGYISKKKKKKRTNKKCITANKEQKNNVKKLMN